MQVSQSSKGRFVSSHLLHRGRTALVGVALAGAVWAAPRLQDGGSVERYVRAKQGATVRVFQDRNAKAVTTLGAGDLLRVHRSDEFELPDGRRLVWYQVSSPRGFPVWVYGEFLTPTSTSSVYSVSGNGVHMRPMPESSIASYPLSTTLRAGEQVEFIERANPSLPLAKDWVKVWSPPTARAWIDASQTSPESDVEAGRKAWAAALRELPRAAVVQASVAPGVRSAESGRSSSQAQSAEAKVEKVPAKPKAKVPEEAYRSLNYGNTLLENARKKGDQATEADFQPAIRAYEVVLGMAPKGSAVAETAQRQLELAQTCQELAGLREKLSSEEQRRVAERQRLIEEQRTEQLRDTASWGRFTGRGWVEKVREGRETRYYLRWSGEIVYEIECRSGRYDLDTFVGYQIGVIGSTTRVHTLSTDEKVGEVAKLDVSRIEVIDGGRSGS